jgi:hypothetical protein
MTLKFSSKLDTFIELKGMSKTEFYESIGVSKDYFYNVLMKGENCPSALVIKRIEELYSIKFKASDFEE